MSLAIGKSEPVLSFKQFRHLFVSPKIVLVWDGLALVVDTVIDQMAMGIAIIEMAHKEKLGILDAHQFHVFLCNLRHHLVCQLVLVFWKKTQGNMAYRFWDSGIHLPLELKAVYDVLCRGLFISIPLRMEDIQYVRLLKDRHLCLSFIGQSIISS